VRHSENLERTILCGTYFTRQTRRVSPFFGFPGREGIIRYDGDLTESTNGEFNAIIRSILLMKIPSIFPALMCRRQYPLSLKAGIPFASSLPLHFQLENETLFSTYLENRDNSWSEWTPQDFREFGNLSPANIPFA
jgi:hypothetical protein